MSEERNWMQAARCGEKSKRGCVSGQHYFLYANARLDCAQKYYPKNQDGNGRRNEPTVSANTHDFSLVTTEFIQPPCQPTHDPVSVFLFGHSNERGRYRKIFYS